MKYLLIILSASLALGSCSLHNPEFRGGEKFELEKLDGNTVKFTAGAKVYNGNWFGVKVKPSKLDLYIDGKHMGKVSLDKKVKMKRKQETDLEAPFTAELEGNAMVEALKLAMKNDVRVQLKGKLKAGVFIFWKKIDFNESRTVRGKKFVTN